MSGDNTIQVYVTNIELISGQDNKEHALFECYVDGQKRKFSMAGVNGSAIARFVGTFCEKEANIIPAEGREGPFPGISVIKRISPVNESPSLDM